MLENFKKKKRSQSAPFDWSIDRNSDSVLASTSIGGSLIVPAHYHVQTHAHARTLKQSSGRLVWDRLVREVELVITVSVSKRELVS